MAKTNHLKLNRWDLVRVPRLAVNYSQLYDCALDMAPDHAPGERSAGRYFSFAPTSGPDQTRYIRSLGRGADTAVVGSLFAFVQLCVGDGVRSCVWRRTCENVRRICSDFWPGPTALN